MTERVQLLLVAVGLIGAQLLLSLQPTADANGDIDLFPSALLWLGAMVLASGLVMVGMLGKDKESGWQPLLGGIVGSGLILFLQKAEHGVGPNMVVVAIFVALWLLFSLLRRACSPRGK